MITIWYWNSIGLKSRVLGGLGRNETLDKEDVESEDPWSKTVGGSAVIWQMTPLPGWRFFDPFWRHLLY